MLAVGPSELTKNLLQELAKGVTLRWGKVTDNLKCSWVLLCAGHRKNAHLEFRVTA